MRSVFVLTAFSLSHDVSADCVSPLIDTALSVFNVSGIDALPNAVLQSVQATCAAGNCPTVPTPCGNQSVDAVECDIPVFESSVKIGTDLVCNAACDDSDCKRQCSDEIEGDPCDAIEDVNYYKCKVKCLGIDRCVHRCEDDMWDSCRQKLVDTCKNTCETAFQSCNNVCESVLTMEITGSITKVEHVISSLSIPKFDLDCQGDGVFKPLVFNASFVGRIDGFGIGIKIHTRDAGIPSTNSISLDQLTANLLLPASGNIQCGLRKNQKNISVTFGDAALTDFDLDVNVELDIALRALSSLICLDLPFCKNAIQDGIDGAIKSLIVDNVPDAVEGMITPTLQSLVTGLTCPGSSVDEESAVITI